MFQLTNEQIAAYEKDGFIIVPGCFSKEAINTLYNVAIDDKVMSNNAIDINDSTGKRSKLSLWFKPGDDVYGLLTRSESLVNAVDHLMEGATPVCHFHSKLMQKEPRVGGAWEWHQDYGYWYKNQFLLPDQMMSVMVAITDANRLNGCLQVIKGSHKMGRVEHGFAGEQNGASQAYVDLALKTMEHVYVELKAGDVLFFHSNLLHRSEANLSDNARWSLISCYNRQANTGYNKSTTDVSSITPILTVPDSALLQSEARGLSQQDSSLMKKEEDVALK
jgi:phytanoyl-CoA hydroxylase